MSKERGTEGGAAAATPLHDKWQMDVVPISESTTEDERRRQPPTGWLLVVVDLTGWILGVRLFGEKPRSHEIAAVFEEIREWCDDREPNDEVSLPMALELGFGLWGRSQALEQRTVLRGTEVVGPNLEEPGWMPGRAAEYLERKARAAGVLILGVHPCPLECFLEDTALPEFNGKPRSEREEILRGLEEHSPCAAGVPPKPHRLRKVG